MIAQSCGSRYPVCAVLKFLQLQWYQCIPIHFTYVHISLVKLLFIQDAIKDYSYKATFSCLAASGIATTFKVRYKLLMHSYMPWMLIIICYEYYNDVLRNYLTHVGSCGRVVKVMDLKSIGIIPRRFESCQLRALFFTIFFIVWLTLSSYSESRQKCW